jgi:hypothetical protein
VSNISGNNLTVKTEDGRSITVMMDANTKVTKGTTKLAAAALKVGDRVVASGPEDKNMIMAETVKVAAEPAPAKEGDHTGSPRKKATIREAIEDLHRDGTRS